MKAQWEEALDHVKRELDFYVAENKRLREELDAMHGERHRMMDAALVFACKKMLALYEGPDAKRQPKFVVIEEVSS